MKLNRRTFLLVGGAAAASALFVAGRALAAALPSIGPTLTARDPLASKNAQNVYSHLVALENKARAGTSPMTIMGQHIEGQNELYNPDSGDTGGTTYVGYYYNKVEAITGRLPGFVEIDFGPGWNSENGWGIFNPRGYDDGRGLPTAQKQWQYLDDGVDLAFDVWKGFPRPADGTYDYDGTAVNIDGSTSVSAPLANGGSAAGIVGVSFHQPYPGSTLKDYSQVLSQSAGLHPGGNSSYPVATITTGQAWFDGVVNSPGNTAGYQDLLTDLAFAADQLSYFAGYDVPVLLRPYHEMNGDWFWWGGKTPGSYQQLWQIMYNYLVNTRGLHNLIFRVVPEHLDAERQRGPLELLPWRRLRRHRRRRRLQPRLRQRLSHPGDQRLHQHLPHRPAELRQAADARRNLQGADRRQRHERPHPQPLGHLERLGPEADRRQLRCRHQGHLLRHRPRLHRRFRHRIRPEHQLEHVPHRLMDPEERASCL